MKRNLPHLHELGVKELLEDRILVQVVDSGEQKTKAGIILLDKDIENAPRKGIVIGTGPGEIDDRTGETIRAMKAKRGDYIMYGKYEGTEINFGGQEYHMVRMLGVMAFLIPPNDNDSDILDQEVID